MQQAEIMAWAAAKMQLAADPPMEVGYRFYHGQRVAQLALALADREALSVDRDLLLIGALLHDVGKVGGEGKEHGPRGARLIAAEIAHLFSAAELERVTTIVASHYLRPKGKFQRGQPDPGWPAEVLLVQDADTLDHFGANGIWIAWHFAALKRSNQAETMARHSGVDQAWHQESRQAMNYPSALIELERRIAFMDAFMQQWAREGQGLLHK